MIKKLLKFVFNIIRGSKEDDIGAYSAQSAFFMTISVIPFIMLLISFIKFLPISQAQLLSYVVDIFPGAAKGLIASVIDEVFRTSGVAVISITAVSVLWAASLGVYSVAKGLNRVFLSNEAPNFLRTRLMSLVYTLALLVVLVLCLGLFVFGGAIEEIVKTALSHPAPALLFLGLRRIIGVVVLSLFFLLMYMVVPNRKTRLFTQLPGSVLSGVGWVGFSYVFSFYYENIASFPFLYGSLAALVFFMLWIFICIYILFIGAEVNKYFDK